MKTILVPVDLSPVTKKICQVACDLAKSTGSAVVLLHVVQPLGVQLRGIGFAGALVSGMMTTLEKRVSRSMLALGERCRNTGVKVQVVQRTGRVVPTILAKAAAIKADCIVLGSHGYGAAYDLLVGSTTQGVLRRSPCAVLVVPTGRRR